MPGAGDPRRVAPSAWLGLRADHGSARRERWETCSQSQRRSARSPRAGRSPAACRSRWPPRGIWSTVWSNSARLIVIADSRTAVRPRRQRRDAPEQRHEPHRPARHLVGHPAGERLAVEAEHRHGRPVEAHAQRHAVAAVGIAQPGRDHERLAARRAARRAPPAAAVEPRYSSNRSAGHRSYAWRATVTASTRHGHRRAAGGRDQAAADGRVRRTPPAAAAPPTRAAAPPRSGRARRARRRRRWRPCPSSSATGSSSTAPRSRRNAGRAATASPPTASTRPGQVAYHVSQVAPFQSSSRPTTDQQPSPPAATIASTRPIVALVAGEHAVDGAPVAARPAARPAASTSGQPRGAAIATACAWRSQLPAK